MRRVFVAGCGFVGLATARLLHRAGWEVIGGVHSAKSAAQLAGEPFPVRVCDVTDRASVAALATAGGLEAVILCASSSRGGVE
ncbi:MAG: NAD-dependent epimerase/dehydratase family protein, partial [Verrucomicrobiota bacterium]|nr:NAD-dependent epimerase/dehydratase family protein [Verrucomicrobiota bacterium]